MSVFSDDDRYAEGEHLDEGCCTSVGGPQRMARNDNVWLDALTSCDEFFRPCRRCSGTHSGRDALVTYFDLDDAAKLCNFCKETHAGHSVLQIRRSSYHDVVKVSDISRLYDIAGLQPYVINGDKVVFLRQRPQPRPPKGCVFPAKCHLCSRQLMDEDACYCSLRCKLEVEHPLNGSAPRPQVVTPARPVKVERVEQPDQLPTWGGRAKRSQAAMNLTAGAEDETKSADRSSYSREDFGTQFCHSEEATAEVRIWAGRLGGPSPVWAGHRGTHKRKAVPFRAPLQ